MNRISDLSKEVVNNLKENTYFELSEKSIENMFLNHRKALESYLCDIKEDRKNNKDIFGDSFYLIDIVELEDMLLKL